RTLRQDSQGGTVTYVYDALNRLTSEQSSGQTALRLDLTYTAQDEIATQSRYKDLAGTQSVGTSSFTYDALGEVTNLQHKDGTNNPLANYTYTYDGGGRLQSEQLNGAAPITYQYDTTNQLTNDTAHSYSYDLNGNR